MKIRYLQPYGNFLLKVKSPAGIEAIGTGGAVAAAVERGGDRTETLRSDRVITTSFKQTRS